MLTRTQCTTGNTHTHTHTHFTLFVEGWFFCSSCAFCGRKVPRSWSEL